MCSVDFLNQLHRHSVESGFESARQFPRICIWISSLSDCPAFGILRRSIAGHTIEERSARVVARRSRDAGSQHGAIDSRRINSRSSQQVLGSYSPTSMSTIRVPPKTACSQARAPPPPGSCQQPFDPRDGASFRPSFNNLDMRHLGNLDSATFSPWTLCEL